MKESNDCVVCEQGEVQSAYIGEDGEERSFLG